MAESKGITLPIVYKSNDAGLKQASKSLEGFGKQLAGIGAAIAGAFAIGKITAFAKESIAAAEGVKQANDRIEAIAKSTQVFGAETGKVTDRLIKFAEANELVIATDAEVIKAVQGQLLTFKGLSASADEAGGAFDRTTLAAFNMAAAGFGSAESNAIALGKAMEDPVKGLSALRRSGTVFTQEQQDLIKSMVATGDVAGAQEVILKELESQYGGVAAATATASEKLRLAGDNIKEDFGAALLPVFATLVEGLLPVFDQIGTALGEAATAATPALESIAGQIPGLIEGFIPLIPLLGDIAGLFIELVAAALPFISDIMAVLMPVLEALLPVIIDSVETALKPLLDVFLELVPTLAPLVAELLPVFAEIFATLAPLVAELIAQLAPMVADILPILAELFLQVLEAVMPLVEAFLPVILSLIQTLAPVVVTLVEAFLPLIELILPILVGLLEFLVPIIEWLAELFSVILIEALTWFADKVVEVSEGIATFSEFFQETFENIKSFFETIINTLIGGFESFVNGAIDGVNTLIRAINKLSWKIPKWVGGDLGGKTFGFDFATLSRISLPRVELADGGIVTGPTSALIGEAGPEAVIPLDRFGSMGATYNITVQAGVGDPVRIGEEVVRVIKRYERASGQVFASA